MTPSKDPYNCAVLGTMYHHPFILNMLYKLWFAKMGDSDGVLLEAFFNPNGQGIPFETIALVLAAVGFSGLLLNFADHAAGSQQYCRV